MILSSSLPSILMEEINASSTTVDIPKNVKIISVGDFMDFIPFVKKGTVRVFIEDEETKKEQLLYYVSDGETCLMSMIASFGDRISKVSAITDTECQILKVPNSKVRTWQTDYKEWNDLILNLFLKRYWDLLDTINALSFKRIDERLYSYLKKNSPSNGSIADSRTHREIANDLGTSREVISRSLKKLQLEGKIK
jgi:CRP/FNR family transcriptional regulator